MELFENLDHDDRQSLRTTVTTTARAIQYGQGGSRDEARRWVGELRSGHDLAAQIALLATSSLTQACRMGGLDSTVARDCLPSLFPHDLPQFVNAYATRFLSDPKAWDRNVGIDAMFDWAQQGLIAPPTQHGAVLVLLCWAPGPSAWTYIRKHPVTITTTLPRLFDVPGIKGASAAQHDETAVGGRYDNYVIPRLIRECHWQRDDVLTWCDRALAVPRSAYEYRWFHSRAHRISALTHSPNP